LLDNKKITSKLALKNEPGDIVNPVFVITTRYPALMQKSNKKKKRSTLSRLGVAAMLHCWVLPSALAQQDMFSVVTGGSIRHESNLFRRPEATASADTIKTGYVGFRLDKPYSLQRFQLDLTETAHRYEQFDRLNLNATDYRAAWLWAVTPRITGTLSATRTEAPTSFELTGITNQRNVSISEQRLLNFDGWVSGGWHVIGAVAQSDQKSEQPVETRPDFRSTSAEGGIRYVAPSANSISVVRRATEGDYLTPVTIGGLSDRRFHEDETEVRVSWVLTRRSALSGRMSWMERESALPQRNFAGPSADVSYTWTPTGKLSVIAAARRTIGPLQNASFNYSQNQAFSLSPAWQITGKTALRLRAERTTTEYRGTGIVPPTEPAREDTLDTAQLILEWAALRTLTVSARLERQKRSTNIPGLEFEATIGSASAAFRF
jgi:exopolysaccharide biosynthesis operon protein EpsL